MSRPAGGTVHVGKAAAIIVAGLVLGVIVLRDNGFGGGSISSAAVRAPDNFTQTTLGSEEDDATTDTTLGGLRAPAQIRVIAVNATGQAGRATQATTRLRQAGYNALQPGNATQAVTSSRPASVVYVVAPGYDREAAVIAALFGLPASAVQPLPTPSPSPDITDNANIAVLVGSGITLS